MTTERVPRSLLWLCYLYIASLPFFSFTLFNWGDRGFGRPDWLLGAALVVVFACKLAIGRIRLRRSPANKFVAFYVYSGLLSAANLFNATDAQFIDFGTKAAQLLLVTAVFFVISSLPLGEQELKNILKVWFLVAFVVAAYAVYQLFARLYDWPFASLALSNPTTAPGGIQTARRFVLVGGELKWAGRGTAGIQYAQVSSFLREPSWLGSYLLSGLFLFGVLILSDKGHLVLLNSSRLNWLFLGTLLLGLLVSVSLGAYASLLATLALMYAVQRVYRLRVTRSVLLLLVLLLLSGLLFSAIGIDFFGVASARLSGLFGAMVHGSGGGTSYGVRLERSLAALKVWVSNPLLGVGLNNTHYHTAEGISLISNGWAELLSSQGLIGFMAMVLILWSLLRGLHNLLKVVDPSSWWYFLIVGLLFVLVSDTIDTLFSHVWTHPLRWFTLSMANLVYIQASARFGRSASSRGIET
mgnify:CR=1 FL=1